MQEADDWAGAAHLRQGLYRMTASALLPPTSAGLDELTGAAEMVVELGIDGFPFAAAVRDFAGSLRDPGDVAWLEVEYVRLFESGVDGALCPPYESFYAGGSRGVRDAVAVTSAVLERTYSTLGLQATGGALTTPDHVATELEVMSALCGREADAWTRSRAEVADAAGDGVHFLDRHLLGWLPDFTRRVRRHAHADMYRTATTAALALAHHDRLVLTTLSRQLTAVGMS